MKMIQKIKFNPLSVQLLVLTGILLLFSFIVVKDFVNPLVGSGDINIWDYMGFYFYKNLKFTPLPRLNLVNNQVFYPYGINSVFQGWGIERDLFYAMLYSQFGVGPWLQIYYILSILITAIGTFVLLVFDYGWVRSLGAATIVNLFGFYAINKYSYHINISLIHWTNLSLIADFLIVRKVAYNQKVSLILIFTRLVLLILSLGEDLGYIAGYALMSFTVSTLFVATILTYRYLKAQVRLTELFARTIESYKRDFLTHSRTAVALIVIGIITTYMYLPLVWQIAREAKSFDFTGVASGTWWTSGYRLLIPYLPGFNPKLPFEQVLADIPEGLGAGSPGWFLIIIGSLGLWEARKRIIIFVPLLIIFLLCVLYYPDNIPSFTRLLLLIIGILLLWVSRQRVNIFLPLLFVLMCIIFSKNIYFPSLKIFPWFLFNRVPGRSTIIYPVILCLFALEINLNKLINRRRLLSAFLIAIACLEIYTAYSFKLDIKTYSFDPNFFNYMNYVKKQPGEAVLDWPFCAKGGNRVGFNDGLCPYYKFNSSIFSLRRFHDKKVMGQYFGRLHPSQIKSYLQAGWDKLLAPNHAQTKCFTPEEWSYFTDFYTFNNFAGINLYVDLLPDDCVAEFYSRFGTPVIETVVPEAGEVKFIPKSPELRQKTNQALGASIKLKDYLK